MSKRTVERITFSAPPDVLVMFVISEHPKDYPQGYVVRAQIVRDGQIEMGPAWTALTLEAARDLIPLGRILVPRASEDDPVIVESWI
jgi:hypothetical protein